MLHSHALVWKELIEKLDKQTPHKYKNGNKKSRHLIYETKATKNTSQITNGNEKPSYIKIKIRR